MPKSVYCEEELTEGWIWLTKKGKFACRTCRYIAEKAIKGFD